MLVYRSGEKPANEALQIIKNLNTHKKIFILCLRAGARLNPLCIENECSIMSGGASDEKNRIIRLVYIM